jgi:hypothetical protein
MPIDISKNPARQRGRGQGAEVMPANGSTKLTAALVEAMRGLRAEGWSYYRIGAWLSEEHGVDVRRKAVNDACRGITWPKAPGPAAVARLHTRRPGSRSVGAPRGEQNTQTRLTRRLVDCILIMHEEHGVGYRRLKTFLWDWHGVAVSIGCIRQICRYQRWLEPIEIWD